MAEVRHTGGRDLRRWQRQTEEPISELASVVGGSSFDPPRVFYCKQLVRRASVTSEDDTRAARENVRIDDRNSKQDVCDDNHVDSSGRCRDQHVATLQNISSVASSEKKVLTEIRVPESTRTAMLENGNKYSNKDNRPDENKIAYIDELYTRNDINIDVYSGISEDTTRPDENGATLSKVTTLDVYNKGTSPEENKMISCVHDNRPHFHTRIRPDREISDDATRADISKGEGTRLKDTSDDGIITDMYKDTNADVNRDIIRPDVDYKSNKLDENKITCVTRPDLNDVIPDEYSERSGDGTTETSCDGLSLLYQGTRSSEFRRRRTRDDWLRAREDVEFVSLTSFFIRRLHND